MKSSLMQSTRILITATVLFLAGCGGEVGGFGQSAKMPPFGMSNWVGQGLSNRSRYLGSIDKLGPAVTDGNALFLTVTYTRSPKWHVVRVDPRAGSSAFVSKVPSGCRPVARKVVSSEEARPGGKTEACVCVWSDGSKQTCFAPRVRCLGIGGVGDRAVNLPSYGIDPGAATLAVLCLPAAAVESVLTGSVLFAALARGAGG